MWYTPDEIYMLDGNPLESVMSEVVTILAVDDDSMHTELIGNIMSEVGCRVIKCFNGLEAVQILEQIPEIDAILVDLQMPVMNGHELISFVKQSAEWQHIPLVALTGNPHEVTHTLSLGASEFLAKTVQSGRDAAAGDEPGQNQETGGSGT